MPTYIVSAATGRLDAAARQKIATGITTSHSGATGAQGFFAQVIFNDIPAGHHFIGGHPLQDDQIFVHGHIRGGRTAQQKHALLEGIVDVIQAAVETPRRHIWAYVAELPPSQMVEYGMVLPEPGSEGHWLESMPEADRDYLLNIGLKS